MRDRSSLKKRLVGAVIGALADIRPPNWALTEQYQLYVQSPDTEAVIWIPELSYYISLMRRFIDSELNSRKQFHTCNFSQLNTRFHTAINGKTIFYLTDWRFNEFPNAAAHSLYVTCVELLSLPVGPVPVANQIIDVIIKGYTVIPQEQMHSWINAVGILMAALPESYWSVIYDRLQEAITSTKMVDWTYRYSPFEMFNFKTVKEAMLEKNYVLLLAIAQSILHHSSIGQIATLAEYVYRE